jgi:hypothetical protein
MGLPPPALSDLEAFGSGRIGALNRVQGDFDLIDPGRGRPTVHELDSATNRFFVAYKTRLDSAIGQISDKTRKAKRVRSAAGGFAKKNSLYPTADEDMGVHEFHWPSVAGRSIREFAGFINRTA